MTTCCVCIQDFTKQPSRKQACCPYCDVKTCVACVQTYLLSTHEDAHCMECRRGWTREVLDTICLTTWINGTYKKHRENQLLDRERARLPAAQLLVERRKLGEELEPERLKIILKIAELEKEINVYRLDYYAMSARIATYYRGEDPDARGGDAGVNKLQTEERRVFIMPCPATSCRGFLSQAYKCGVCDTYVCPECREIKNGKDDATHVCEESTVATVRALKKDTRPCPDCGTCIFKIEGCFAKDTPILLWNGTTKMSQDIVVGDELVGDDGKKRIVESTVTGEDNLYEIKQQKGVSYTVNSKHTLVLKSRESLDTAEIIVDEFMKFDIYQKHQYMGYKVNINGEFLEMTEIAVSFKERGTYYGWSVDSNHRFLHEDFTVMRNCNQMFCTNCNTPFDWVSGKKITNGAIHNPHYFEYLRATNGGIMPRNPGDIPCGANLPGAWSFEREVTRRYPHIAASTTDWLYRALQTITHIQHAEIPNLTNHAQDMDNTEYNVRYITNEINETRWKQLLQMREKRRVKRDEIRMRYEAFVGACVDIYGRLMEVARAPPESSTGTPGSRRQVITDNKTQKETMTDLCRQAKEQLLVLREIFNSGMMDISKRYKCQVLQLSDVGLSREMRKYDAGKGKSRRVKKSDGDTVDNDSEGVAEVEDDEDGVDMLEEDEVAPQPKNELVRS